MRNGRVGLLAVVFFVLGLAGCTRKTADVANTTSDGRLAPMLKNLGNLHHPVTAKSADAQKYFDQGLTLIYAFNHAEALRSFKEVARLDPQCAMAHWGQALALAPNINDSAIGPDREQQGYDAIAQAVKLRGNTSEPEQALIDALAARFSGSGQRDRKALNQTYADAMAKVYAHYPQDSDVAALYADAVMNTMPWDYWRNNTPNPGIQQARKALEGVLARDVNHPGANHLYIHLMEASDYVDLAVPSADRLGSLVPAAGHLVHMPAHAYIRVGRYSDAASVNLKAIAADEDYITQCRAQGIYPAAYYPHNIHFLNAVLMMDGRKRESLESARKVATRHDHNAMKEPGFGFVHLLKAIPALTMVRFGQWNEVLQEPEPAENQLFERGMRHFARGYAFSAQGKAAEAGAELALLKTIAADPRLAELKIFDINSCDQLAKIADPMLEGELARRNGKLKEAIAGFRTAVEREDALLYSEPPDWPIPPRQYLGEALLAAGRASEAERVYREDLRRHRDNGWSLFGLEQALRKQGKTSEADDAKAKFERAWARSDVQLAASRF